MDEELNPRYLGELPSTGMLLSEGCTLKVHQRVYLSISSRTLDPATVTARLGLKPDEVLPKGSSPRGPAAIPIPAAHLWRLLSRAPSRARLDEHVDALLSRIGARASAIRELAASGEAAVYVAIVRTLAPEADAGSEDLGADEHEGETAAPIGFHLGPATLARLADLGVGMDVDEYGPADGT